MKNRKKKKKKVELNRKNVGRKVSKSDLNKKNRNLINRKEPINNGKGNLNISNKKSKKVIAQEEKYKRQKRRKRRLILALIIFLILLVMYSISVYKWGKIMKDIVNCQNSVILDSSGNVIAVLGESRIQENISIDEIPENLKNAYIAVEDKTFNKHHGINFKRTAGATLSFITNKGSSAYGGSTITQQLVKNVTGENESKVSRKIKEWDRAIKTEIVLSKDEILQTYFNIIYVGPNIYGVEKGAQYYFNKSVRDLDLAECAFLAGINNSPNSYNPFGEKDNSEKIKIRCTTVLKLMLEQDYINNEEYNEAIEKVEAGLEFDKGDVEPNGTSVYSYLADAAISEVIVDLSESKEISTSFATNYLYLGGLKIYSTQNSDIQKILEEECEKEKYIKKSTQDKNATTQAAMVIIDNQTGTVVGCIGGVGKKETSRGFNRATQAVRQTGSAIKPIAVLGPALEENIITSASIYNDKKTTFENNYSPNNYEGQLGEITVRRAVESSQNIPFVRIMDQLTSKKAIKYMEKQGITTLTEKDNALPVALGGLQKGISPLQMAGAYASIANNGMYIEPVFYTVVENSKGKVVLKNEQEKHKVYSENTAYVLKKLLEQPILGAYGTAKNCAIDGMETSAKTGTTDNFYDKWLCGFTSYYTAVTWFGYDQNERIEEGTDSLANQMWASVMKKVHKNLIEKDYEKVKNVVEVEICSETGKVAGSKCKKTYIEYFRKENVLKTVCNKH